MVIGSEIDIFQPFPPSEHSPNLIIINLHWHPQHGKLKSVREFGHFRPRNPPTPTLAFILLSKLNSDEGSDFDLFLPNHLRPINFCCLFSPVFSSLLSSLLWSFLAAPLRVPTNRLQSLRWLSDFLPSSYVRLLCFTHCERGVNKNYLSEIIMRIKYFFIDFRRCHIPPFPPSCHKLEHLTFQWSE